MTKVKAAGRDSGKSTLRAYGGGEAVFEVEQRVDLRESQGLKVRELAKAEELATEHRGLIIEKWNEHFNR